MNQNLVPFIIAGAIMIAALLQHFGPKIRTQLDPFRHSRLKLEMKLKQRGQHTIYVFSWRDEYGQDEDPDKEMKKCGIAYLPKELVEAQKMNPDLPKTWSISSKTSKGHIVTLDVNHKLPHDVTDSSFQGKMPRSKFDFYFGIRECHIKEDKTLEHSKSVLGYAG